MLVMNILENREPVIKHVYIFSGDLLTDNLLHRKESRNYRNEEKKYKELALEFEEKFLVVSVGCDNRK